QHYLMQACLANGLHPRILVVSSGDIYAPSSAPLDENSLILPANPYAASKIAQDMMAQQAASRLPVVRARPFNHTGPGQREGFVAPDFAMQIARIEAGLQEPVVRVRNLQAEIDFTDVRDVVAAYHLLMERGTPGEVYNIASGIAYSIQWLLDTLVEHSHLSAYPRVETSGQQTATRKVGDAARIHAQTGWQPSIPFRQTLLDLLNDCRARVR
ncbi:MAG: GDP-mannose 4,6-dehydratase, partial [Anaerolineae bacterium]|nr:GDP-mannose 4,6-dehydratase [Anaerolineae bacterium]